MSYLGVSWVRDTTLYSLLTGWAFLRSFKELEGVFGRLTDWLAWFLYLLLVLHGDVFMEDDKVIFVITVMSALRGADLRDLVL
jgi:hypothetical protein